MRVLQRSRTKSCWLCWKNSSKQTFLKPPLLCSSDFLDHCSLHKTQSGELADEQSRRMAGKKNGKERRDHWISFYSSLCTGRHFCCTAGQNQGKNKHSAVFSYVYGWFLWVHTPALRRVFNKRIEKDATLRQKPWFCVFFKYQKQQIILKIFNHLPSPYFQRKKNPEPECRIHE